MKTVKNGAQAYLAHSSLKASVVEDSAQAQCNIDTCIYKITKIVRTL